MLPMNTVCTDLLPFSVYVKSGLKRFDNVEVIMLNPVGSIKFSQGNAESNAKLEAHSASSSSDADSAAQVVIKVRSIMSVTVTLSLNLSLTRICFFGLIDYCRDCQFSLCVLLDFS